MRGLRIVAPIVLTACAAAAPTLAAQRAPAACLGAWARMPVTPSYVEGNAVATDGSLLYSTASRRGHLEPWLNVYDPARRLWLAGIGRRSTPSSAHSPTTEWAT